MTDDRLDDLASAHLDGATSPEEAAEVAADPRLQARVEALRAVRAALQGLPPVDPGHREAAIAAALAAAAPSAHAVDAVEAPATVTALTATRRRTPTRTLRVLGAAAAVALIAVLVPLLGRLSTSEDDQSTAGSDTSSGDGTASALDDVGASESTAGAEAGGTDLSTTTTPGERRSLGAFDSVDALVAAVENPESGPSGAYDQSAVEPDSLDTTCPAQRAEVEARTSRPVTIASAVVAGQPVTVLLSTADTGALVVLAVLAPDCTALVAGP
jgi:hypothetical protein